MKDYTQEMLNNQADDMSGEAATPASPYLFTVNDKCEPLDENTSDMFHHNTAKLLFLSRRA
jgi:hypothetical protein